ncbi:MAG: hypothetical protein LBT53_03525 [Puniceicoccales bacterium]|nr:hypothetical protein [Puniceicoccales bacterium]
MATRSTCDFLTRKKPPGRPDGCCCNVNGNTKNCFNPRLTCGSETPRDRFGQTFSRTEEHQRTFRHHKKLTKKLLAPPAASRILPLNHSPHFQQNNNTTTAIATATAAAHAHVHTVHHVYFVHTVHHPLTTRHSPLAHSPSTRHASFHFHRTQNLG